MPNLPIICFLTVPLLAQVLLRLKQVKPGQDAAKYISGRYYLCYISLLSGWRNIINAGVPYRYKYIFTSIGEKGHLAGQRWRRWRWHQCCWSDRGEATSFVDNHHEDDEANDDDDDVVDQIEGRCAEAAGDHNLSSSGKNSSGQGRRKRRGRGFARKGKRMEG